jgi:hypothetical protein
MRLALGNLAHWAYFQAAMTKHSRIRIIVFLDQDQWVGQCLEHDVCVQAPRIDLIPPRMELALELEAGALDDLPPAPDQFFKMWETRSTFKHRGRDYEMALCA